MGLIVYYADYCNHCTQLKKFLDRYEVAYKAIDIHEDQQAMQDFKKLGGNVVPFSIYEENNKVIEKITGFNVGKFSQFLR